MYVNLDGYNKIMDRSAKAAQLELENKRQAERDDWDRQSQAELVGQRQRAAEMRQRVQAQARELAGTADDQGYDITPITGGMAPPSVNRQALDAYTPDQGAPAPSTGLVKRAGFKAPSHMDDELKLIRGQMELAGVSGDNRQLLDSQKAYLQHKKQRTAMAIANHFDNADDAELDRIANTITQDKTNKITSVRDPKTGYFLLRSEEGTQRLNRKEMRDYLIAKANGNLDEMSKAQESAMGRAEKDNGREVQMTAPNNQAISYGKRDDNDAARLGLQRDQMGLSKRARDAANWTPIGVSEDGKGLTIYNRETHQTKVQPLPPGTDAAGLFRKLTGASGAADKEFEKIPDDGTRVRDRNGNVLTYNEGLPLVAGGVPPSAQQKALSQAGIPDAVHSLVTFRPGGRYVKVEGVDGNFDITNTADMRELKLRVGELMSATVRDSEWDRYRQLNEQQAAGLTVRPGQGRPANPVDAYAARVARDQQAK